MKKVRATEVGFYGGALRKKGDVFDVTDAATGKWFVPVDSPEAKAVETDVEEEAKLKAEEEKPVALSALNRGDKGPKSFIAQMHRK